MSQPASVTRKVMSMTVRSGPAPQGTVVSNRMDKPDDTLLVRPAAGASGSSGIARYPFEGRGNGTGTDGLIVTSVHQTRGRKAT